MYDERVLYERIYEVVRQVPAGKVASYGDVAAVVGGACDARTVGYALNEVPKHGGEPVPWQRIISSAGTISTRGVRQRQLLEEEGIVFDARGRVDMARARWGGPDPDWAAAHGFVTLAPRGDGEKDQSAQLPLF
jgi:methylated-DNA-protein-cysteine methyltransferase related protein